MKIQENLSFTRILFTDKCASLPLIVTCLIMPKRLFSSGLVNINGQDPSLIDHIHQSGIHSTYFDISRAFVDKEA